MISYERERDPYYWVHYEVKKEPSLIDDNESIEVLQYRFLGMVRSVLLSVSPILPRKGLSMVRALHSFLVQIFF